MRYTAIPLARAASPAPTRSHLAAPWTSISASYLGRQTLPFTLRRRLVRRQLPWYRCSDPNSLHGSSYLTFKTPEPAQKVRVARAVRLAKIKPVRHPIPQQNACPLSINLTPNCVKVGENRRHWHGLRLDEVVVATALGSQHRRCRRRRRSGRIRPYMRRGRGFSVAGLGFPSS